MKKAYTISFDERDPDWRLSLPEDGDDGAVMELTEEDWDSYQSAEATYEAWQKRIEAATGKTRDKHYMELARKLKAGEITEESLALPTGHGQGDETTEWFRRHAEHIKRLAAEL